MVIHRPAIGLHVVMTAAVVAAFVAVDPDSTLRTLAVLGAFAVVFGVLGRWLPSPYGGIVAIVMAATITADPAEAGQSVDATVYALIAVAALTAAFGTSRTFAIGASLGFPVLMIIVGLQGDEALSSTALGVGVAVGLVGAVAFAADGIGTPRTLTRRVGGAAAVAAVVVPLAVLAALVIPQTEPPGDGRRDADGGGDRGGPAASYIGFGDELDVTDPHSPDDAVVMRVDADQTTYWRVQTFATFDGERWTETAAPEDPPVDADRERQPIVQRFEVERSLVGILPAAWQPDRVAVPAEVQTEIRFDHTVSTSGSVPAGTSYVVTGSRPLIGADDLRAATGTVADQIAAAYLSEPAVSGRVRRTAEQVTAGLDNDYDRILALERWIGDQVVYTRDIDPMPDGVDAVDHFLFETRRGFCEQVGTSLVVMAQSLGIPARLAVGYVPAERDDGQWVVRNEHAHAWVEVFFPGVGWQGFDPTAAVPLALDDPTEPPPDDGIDWWPLVAWLAGGAVLVAAAAWLVRRRLTRRTTTPPGLGTAAQAPSDSERLVALAARVGVETAPPRTVGEIADDVAARGGDPQLTQLSAMLDAEAFGATPRSPRQRRWSSDLLDDLHRWVEHNAADHDEHDSIEQPGRERAHSGRFSE